MRSAIVENGVVVNVILGEQAGSIPCDSSVSVGWTYNGTTFNAPVVTPPTVDLAAIERANRDALLAKCDWTQAADCPLCGDPLWVAYRQALRDVPAQTGFPQTINWPVHP